jgi:two-component system chemotaxis response regulator CheB
LDDGTAGLITVKRYGGLAIVQDPREAVEPQMPRSALEHVAVDLCLPVADIARMLPREAAACAGRPKPRSDDPAADYELAIAELDADALTDAHKPGVPSLLSCPDCTGVLSAVHEGGMERFRCQVGHAYSLESLLDAQDHSIERALWTSLRALLERLNLMRRVAGRMHARAQERSHVRLEERILQLENDIAVLRSLLLGRSEMRAPARSEETSPPEEEHASRPIERHDEYAS